MEAPNPLDRVKSLAIISDSSTVVRLCYVSKNGRPFVEYVQSSSDAYYLTIVAKRLQICDRLIVDDAALELPDEWKRLIASGIVSCPAEASGPHEAESIFEALRDWLTRVVYVRSDASLTAMAAYALMTWFAYRYDALPYLRFIGDFGSGKTTALRAMSMICYRSMNISGVTTPATLFRLIDEARGTLAIDEADLDHSALAREIVRILNHGYSRGVAVVRLDKRNRPVAFEPFGPKLIAARREFGDDALGSRCIDVRMERARSNDLERLDDASVIAAARELQKALLFMRLQYAGIESGGTFFRFGPARLPDGLTMRLRQLAMPIFECTPAARQKEIGDYFEAVGIGASAAMLGTEGELRMILRRAAANDCTVMPLQAVYAQLSPAARKRHTKKAVSRMLESMGVERRHGREGMYVTDFSLLS